MDYLNIKQFKHPEMNNLLEKLLFAWFDEVLTREVGTDAWYLGMSGMSGRKYRYLINRITSCLPDANYLEIGSWKGSTLCSVLYNNRVQATAIDNWSEFGDPRDEFMQNTSRAKNPHNQLTVFEQDFRKMDFSSLGRYNMYLFDGPHSAQDQYDGIMLAQPALQSTHLLIVDDWNHIPTQEGTLRALGELGHKVSYVTVNTTPDGSHPYPSCEQTHWHNGYWIGVVERNSRS